MRACSTFTPAVLLCAKPRLACMQVILSSSAHKRGNVQLDDLDFKKSGYDQWKAYGQSKTANIWSALEIERRYGSQGKQCSCKDVGPRYSSKVNVTGALAGQTRNLH